MLHSHLRMSLKFHCDKKWGHFEIWLHKTKMTKHYYPSMLLIYIMNHTRITGEEKVALTASFQVTANKPSGFNVNHLISCFYKVGTALNITYLSS
jgi:hypothetical protein